MLSLIGSLASSILPGLFNVIDQAVEDKDKANELKAKFQLAMMELDTKELEGRIKIVLAEANGNWLPPPQQTRQPRQQLWQLANPCPGF